MMKVRPVDISTIQKAYGQRETVNRTGFAEMLGRMVGDTNTLQTRSAGVTNSAVSGQPVETHNVMIAAEEARLAFDLMLEVRNKIIEAYRELMQMRM